MRRVTGSCLVPLVLGEYSFIPWEHGLSHTMICSIYICAILSVHTVYNMDSLHYNVICVLSVLGSYTYVIVEKQYYLQLLDFYFLFINSSSMVMLINFIWDSMLDVNTCAVLSSSIIGTQLYITREYKDFMITHHLDVSGLCIPIVFVLLFNTIHITSKYLHFLHPPVEEAYV
jgi:hypothetical protein